MLSLLLRPFGFIAPKDFKLFGFPIFRLWAYLMMAIPEMYLMMAIPETYLMMAIPETRRAY